jgi:hypothetical protein
MIDSFMSSYYTQKRRCRQFIFEKRLIVIQGRFVVKVYPENAKKHFELNIKFSALNFKNVDISAAAGLKNFLKGNDIDAMKRR